MNALAIVLSMLTMSPNACMKEETVLFDILHNQKVIGVMTAVKRSEGENIVYENFTNVSTSIITKVEMTYQTRVVYKGNELVETDFKTIVNGRLRAHTQTKKEGNTYQYFENGKVVRTVDSPIQFSSIMLLFQEPKEVYYTYSEETGGFFKIHSSGNLSYRKLNGSGKTSTYYYSAQALQSIAIEGRLFNIEMISKQKS